MTFICKTSGLLQHLTCNKEGWWVYSRETLLANSTSSASWEVRGTSTPLKMPPWDAVTWCPPNGKLGLFLLKIKLEKSVVTRSVGRELGFPSSCSARIASKLFYSVEFPMVLTQLLSVKMMKLRLQITSPAWHGLYSLPAKFQLNLGNFLWITQNHHTGSSGVRRSEAPSSNKIRSHKNTVVED